MSVLFYKTCRHGNCGSSVMFHNKDECGYGTDLKNLETYTLERAQKGQDRMDGSWFLAKVEVDALAVKHVDMQRLDLSAGTPSDDDQICAVQNKGRYDGNDIEFVSEFGATFDLSEAKLVKKKDAINNIGENQELWCKNYLDSISRDTFQSWNINKRKMMTKYGLKYRTPRPSRAQGKTRGNCPECGKITWDFNPYESAFCNDHCYDEFNKFRY